MSEFPTIRRMLRSAFNAEDGLSEDVAIQLYVRAASAVDNKEKLRAELDEAFAREDVAWRELLWNDEYEVVDVETEEAARHHARRILWDPLFPGGRSQARGAR